MTVPAVGALAPISSMAPTAATAPTAPTDLGASATGGTTFAEALGHGLDAVDSASQTAGATTTFDLRGATARYYIVWITNLGSNASVRIEEVTAKG